MTESITFDYRAVGKKSALSYVQIYLKWSNSIAPVAYFNVPGKNFNLTTPCLLKVVPVHISKGAGAIEHFLELRATNTGSDLFFTLIKMRHGSIYGLLPQMGDGKIGELSYVHIAHPQSLLAVVRHGRDWIKAVSIV